MKRRRLWGALLVFLVAVAGMRGAVPDQAQADRIARLIKQLGHDDFDQREAASKELEAVGKPALRPLWQAATFSDDVEIQRRSDQALKALAAKFPKLVQRGEEIRRTGWPNIHIYNTRFSPDGRFHLAGGDGAVTRMYEVQTGKQVQEFVGHGHWTHDVVFLPDGKQVLTASMDKTLRLWEVATGKELRRFEGHQGGVLSVGLNRDGRSAVSGGQDKTLRLWELATGKELRKFEGHTDACGGVFTPDGKQLLSYSHDQTLQLWDVETGKRLKTIQGHAAALYGAFVLPGGKQALSYSADRTARLWDLATGKEQSKLDLGDSLSDIRGVALSPDGKSILVGQDGTPGVQLIELATGKQIHRFGLTTNPRGLSFSPDGQLAAGGSFRGLLYLWRVPGIFEAE